MTAPQLQMEFTPGLLEQFPEFIECVRATVYGCGRPFKHIAADLDMTVAELSRKLADNPNDPVHFPLLRLPALLEATGDTRPVQWLMLTFLQDPEAKRQHALSQISNIMPILATLCSQAGLSVPPVKGRR